MEERMSSFCIKTRNHRNGAVGGTGTKCGRWNPTAEQVKVLTDLFRSGLRTPSTDQIQKISTQLSFYGKIESKNVFYWFQNHKARERQKRRKISVDLDHHHKDLNNIVRSDNLNQNPIDFFEGNRGYEQERVMETLQLFPLNSFEGTKTDKRRLHNANGNGREGCNTTSFPSYSCGAEMDHPPLDLRLSFL